MTITNTLEPQTLDVTTAKYGGQIGSDARYGGMGQDDGANGGEGSFAEMLDAYPMEEPQRGDILNGEILWMGADMLLMDIGAKQDAVVTRQDLNHLDDEMVDGLAVGDHFPVLVLKTPARDDELVVSIKRGLEAKTWQVAQTYQESGEVVTLTVSGANKGGLLLSFEDLTGFAPNSHVPALRYLRDPDQLQERKAAMLGQQLPVKVLEVERRRRRLVVSPREAEEVVLKQRMEELKVGQVVHGTVESVADFGVFVDIGGVTGLIHVSKLDWGHIERPANFFSPGDEVDVRIDRIDAARQRISLNRQAVLPNPWTVLTEQYAVGDRLEGQITNVVDFGLFVRIPLGIEGLVHKSEIALAPGMTLESAYAIGDKMTVRIVRLEPERQRLGLSLLEIEPTWVVAEEEATGADDAAEEQAPDAQGDMQDKLPVDMQEETSEDVAMIAPQVDASASDEENDAPEILGDDSVQDAG